MSEEKDEGVYTAGRAGHIRLALTVESEVMAEACRRIRALAEHLVG